MNKYHHNNILDSLITYLINTNYIYVKDPKDCSILLDIYLKRFDIVKYREINEYLRLVLTSCYLETSNRLIIVNALKELGQKTASEEDRYDQIFIDLYQLLDNKIKSYEQK